MRQTGQPSSHHPRPGKNDISIDETTKFTTFLETQSTSPVQMAPEGIRPTKKSPGVPSTMLGPEMCPK